MIEADLNAAFVHADFLSVQRVGVVLSNYFIVGADKDIVFLSAHGQVGKQHAFSALRSVGNVAHQVEFPVQQHLKQLWPASLDIFKLPAGIRGDFALILIGIAGTPSMGIHHIERRLKPAHAHSFAGWLRIGGNWQKYYRQHEKAKQKGRESFSLCKSSFTHSHLPPSCFTQIISALIRRGYTSSESWN